ncbi:hypothetical protein ACFQ1S_12980, partial [Kibdelosporangium lantanae]
YLAATGADGWLRIWSTRTWDIEYETRLSAEAEHSVAFSPDGSLLAIGGFPDGVFQVWPVDTWKPLWERKVSVRFVDRVEFTAADRLEVEGRRATRLVTTTWNTRSRREVDRSERYDITEDFDPDVDTTADLYVRTPSLSVRAHPRAFTFSGYENTDVLFGSTRVSAVAVSPAGDFVVTGGLSGTWLWSATTDRWTALPTPDVSAPEKPAAGDTAKLVLGETTKPDEPTPEETEPQQPAAKPVDQEPGWLFTPQTPQKRDPRDAEPPGWLFIPQDPPGAETPAATCSPD